MTVSPANAAPTFTADSPPLTATVGTPYAYTFAATGVPDTITYSLVEGAPAFLSIDSETGAVSGTPPTGTTTFTYSVTASNGITPDATAGPFTVTVSPANAAPTFTADTPPTHRHRRHPLRLHLPSHGRPRHHHLLPGRRGSRLLVHRLRDRCSLGDPAHRDHHLHLLGHRLERHHPRRHRRPLHGDGQPGQRGTDLHRRHSADSPPRSAPPTPTPSKPRASPTPSPTPWSKGLPPSCPSTPRPVRSRDPAHRHHHLHLLGHASNGITPDATAGPFTVTVSPANAAPTFTADSPPLTATVGTPYAYTFAATGVPDTITYSLVEGAPAFLSIDSETGAVSGTPPTGTTTFTYSVTPRTASPPTPPPAPSRHGQPGQRGTDLHGR